MSAGTIKQLCNRLSFSRSTIGIGATSRQVPDGLHFSFILKDSFSETAIQPTPSRRPWQCDHQNRRPGLGLARKMKKDLLLAIDVGTGSVRAALIGLGGETVAFSAQEHDQIVPQFGWSEQRPQSWWQGAVASIRTVLGKVDQAPRRIEA